MDAILQRQFNAMRRADWRAGEIVAALVNANRNTDKYPEPLPWTRFFPDPREAKQAQSGTEQTWQEQLMRARLWTTLVTEQRKAKKGQ